MKELSCGFVLTDRQSGKILACKPTGSDRNLCDIPKGHINIGETPLQCAFRELNEETGILEDEVSDIEEIGRLPYQPYKKDLHIFKAVCNIDLAKLHCDSTFVDSFGNVQTEVSGYLLVEPTEDVLMQTFFPRLVPIIKFALNL